MKKLILPLVAFALIYSCGPEEHPDGELRPLNGGKYAGKVLHLNEVEDFRNLYPLDITEVTSHRIANQIYEGLVRLSQKDLTIVEGLAETWTKNEDATVWTFKIRKGVKFHEDECFGGKAREVTANDFKWCFDHLCTASPHNQMYDNTFKNRVKGANEYYQSTKDKKPLEGGVSGVKVVDEYTLEITLYRPMAGFLNILAIQGCYLFPKEAFEKYGEDGMRIKTVGTGAFMLKSLKEGESVILERNPDYWAMDADGNQLPYLDGVRFSFIKEKKQEFLEFKKGNLDMLFRIPTENIQDILHGDLEKAKENKPFELQVTPAMSLFYYGFLHTQPPFNDKRVCLAFNHAIDRQKIVDFTLKGEGVPALAGIVPSADNFKTQGYNFDGMKGYTYDPDLAKKLLAEAGYPEGKGFPHITLQINSGGGDRNGLTAQVVQSMLKENLNIEINIETLPFTQHLDKIENGQTLFWRSGWIADYPDPETFLTLLSSSHIPANPNDRSFLNTTRFRNAQYDSLFAQANREVDDKKRFDLYRQADQVAVDEGALMPIFYDEIYRLVQNNVKGFDVNAMEYRDVSRVYFIPDDPKKKGKE